MQPSYSRGNRSPAQLEAEAREAVHLRVGRSLTDCEWAPARARLLEFVRILRAWEQTSSRTPRGNVEVSSRARFGPL